MNQQTQDFLADLKTVCDKYKIRVSPVDTPEGIDWVFSNNDIWLNADTIADLLETD